MSTGIRNILLPFSALYGGVVTLRNFGYDTKVFKSQRLPVPVISVGNISVGGSGKTPFVMFLIEKLLALGKKPAVLSRGYKRMTDELVISCPSKGAEVDVQLIGDEPALISQTFPDVPVGVEKDRHRAGLEILKHHPVDVFVLDDGLQNRELHRDIDFVLIGRSLQDLKDHYLPAGNLRDSKRRISQSDIIVLTSHNVTEPVDSSLNGLNRYSGIPTAGISFVPSHFVDRVGVSHPLDTLAGKEVAAFCGIAHPDQFFKGIESIGAKLIYTKTFRDHHWFDEYDIDEIFGGNEDLISVTTAKDAVRIFIDEELSEAEEVKRILALHEKAVVNFGEEHIDGILSKVFGGVYA